MTRQTALTNSVILLSGALLGLTFWQLLGIEASNASLDLAACAGLASFAVAMLALVGAMRLRRAALGAGGLGLLIALLFAVMGVEDLASFLRRDLSGGLLWGWLILSLMPLSGLRAWGAGQGLQYPSLWSAALELSVIGGLTLTFTVLSWGGILLAAQLLELVGLPVTNHLFEHDLLPALLTGLLIGGAVMVVRHWPLEHAGSLLAKIIRLLAPPLFIVMLVFVAALAVNGFSAAVGPSVRLMSWSVLSAALLISVIAGPSGRPSTANRFWYLTAGGLIAAMIPVAFAALWRVIGDVQADGATPEAIVEAGSAAFCLFLALGYGGAVLRKSSVGGINMVGAAALMAWAALLVPGLISPEALAVRHQLARLDRGEVRLEDLPLRSMVQYWGEAGQAGIETLRQRFANDPKALDRIAMMQAQSQPPIFMTPMHDSSPAVLSDLAAKLVVVPKGAVSVALFVDAWDVPVEAARSLSAACDRRTPGGNPGCLAVLDDFLPEEAGDELLLFSMEPGPGEGGRVTAWRRQGPLNLWQSQKLSGDMYLLDAAAAIDHIHAQGVELRPVATQALILKDQKIFILPNTSD